MLGILSPKSGLNLLLSSVKSQTGKKDMIECDIILDSSKESLVFKIDGEDFEIKHDSLKTMFETLASEKVKEGSKVDYVIIRTKKDSDYYADIYSTNNQGKFKETIKL
jgi:hypothetical protein